MLCILVRGGTLKKGHNKGHKWPFSVCVNLRKGPSARELIFHSTIVEGVVVKYCRIVIGKY